MIESPIKQRMIREATIADHSLATQIHALSLEAYALEAKQIGCAKFPPLAESLEQLQKSSDRFLVFQQAGSILGVLSFVCSGDLVSITRLFVRPRHFRQGIATSLIAFLEGTLSAGVRLSVSTATANTPAVRLYTALGYVPNEVTTSEEGISLTHFFNSL